MATRRAGVQPLERRGDTGRPVPGGDAALALVPAVVAMWVHRGALGAYFTTDDLILFERMRGLAAFPATLWRLISGRLYYQAFFPLFGTQPLGWHVVGLLAHGATTVLVTLWARQIGASRQAAFFAAIVFGASARARNVVWQMSSTGETLAALLLFSTLLLLASRARWGRTAAAGTHAAAMLCKESVALAPLAHVAAAPDKASMRARLGQVAPALVVSAAVWIYMLLSRSRLGSLGGAAYAFGWGRHMFDHLLLYVLWSTDLLHVSDAIPSPLPAAWAVFAFALLASLELFAWRSNRPAARAGLVLWGSLLLPVLPLVSAVYDHYVYAGRAGMALVMGEALVALVARRDRRPSRSAVPGMRAWWAVGVLGLLVPVTGALWLATASVDRLPQVGLLRDSFLRKMEMIRNISTDLSAALGPEPARLVVYAPSGDQLVVGSTSGRVLQETEGARRHPGLLRAVLDDGRGLRALLPQLTEVRFEEHVAASDGGAVIAANTVDGHVQVFGRGPEAHAAVSSFWRERGLARQASEHLAEAAALYPTAATLRPERAVSDTEMTGH